jgi:hypothetical protein
MLHSTLRSRCHDERRAKSIEACVPSLGPEYLESSSLTICARYSGDVRPSSCNAFNDLDGHLAAIYAFALGLPACAPQLETQASMALIRVLLMSN